MAKSNNHKMALLYMMRELLLKTDEEHALNASDLIRALENMDLEADRRTIYSNVEILQDFGLDVIKKENGIHHREEIAGTDWEADAAHK